MGSRVEEPGVRPHLSRGRVGALPGRALQAGLRRGQQAALSRRERGSSRSFPEFSPITHEGHLGPRPAVAAHTSRSRGQGLLAAAGQTCGRGWEL